MRIGYCSPFSPLKSGISDFSEELVQELNKYIEISIFSPVEIVDEVIRKNFDCHLLTQLDVSEIRNTLDLIVYHVGNNYDCHNEIIEMLFKYPGIVELHEIGLHNFLAQRTLIKKGEEEYLDIVHYCHGDEGVEIAKKFLAGLSEAPWDLHPLDMNMSRIIIEKAHAIIVHSDMVKQMVLGMFPNIPIVNIMHHSEMIVSDSQKYKFDCRDKLNIAKNIIVFGIFGFATEEKRLLSILNGLEKFQKEYSKDFIFFIVGDVQDKFDIQKELITRDLQAHVIVTGFVSLELFKQYMGACDFCLNLRYPTRGESSGSLHRMFGMGKPVIVTNVGTFQEYPDNIVIKVSYGKDEDDDILNALEFFAKDKKNSIEYSNSAHEFARRYCDIHINAKKYCEFFLQVKEGTWQPDYIDTLVEKLYELHITDEEYLNEFIKNLDDFLEIL